MTRHWHLNESVHFEGLNIFRAINMSKWKQCVNTLHAEIISSTVEILRDREIISTYLSCVVFTCVNSVVETTCMGENDDYPFSNPVDYYAQLAFFFFVPTYLFFATWMAVRADDTLDPREAAKEERKEEERRKEGREGEGGSRTRNIQRASTVIARCWIIDGQHLEREGEDHRGRGAGSELTRSSPGSLSLAKDRLRRGYTRGGVRLRERGTRAIADPTGLSGGTTRREPSLATTSAAQFWPIWPKVGRNFIFTRLQRRSATAIESNDREKHTQQGGWGEGSCFSRFRRAKLRLLSSHRLSLVSLQGIHSTHSRKRKERKRAASLSTLRLLIVSFLRACVCVFATGNDISAYILINVET